MTTKEAISIRLVAGQAASTIRWNRKVHLCSAQIVALLFAANAGSGDVTVFRVLHNSLAFADKVPSGGSQPVSIAQQGNVVYVLNSGGAGSVVGFRLEHNGHLHRIANSTAFLSANATGGASISISPDGKFVAVVERIANKIDTFRINPDGTLATPTTIPSPGPGAFSAQFAPDGKLIVSETGPGNIPNGSAISSYTVLPDGTLGVVSQSVATDGAANCWNAISPDGNRVYASNAGTSTIAGFAIGDNGVLSPLNGTIVGSNPEGSTNLDIAISGDGRFLYSLNGKVGAIGVFAIQSDGTLREVTQIEGHSSGRGIQRNCSSLIPCCGPRRETNARNISFDSRPAVWCGFDSYPGVQCERCSAGSRSGLQFST